jgi:hypothetical protein
VLPSEQYVYPTIHVLVEKVLLTAVLEVEQLALAGATFVLAKDGQVQVVVVWYGPPWGSVAAAALPVLAWCLE